MFLELPRFKRSRESHFHVGQSQMFTSEYMSDKIRDTGLKGSMIYSTLTGPSTTILTSPSTTATLSSCPLVGEPNSDNKPPLEKKEVTF